MKRGAERGGIAWRLVRPADHRVMPWRNGLGSTAEIAVDPPGSDVAHGFRWRLSIAAIDCDCPFSAFPGYDRTIMVIEGRGMTLTVPGLPAQRMERLYEPFSFQGDEGADCRLIDGPVRDFNLMVDRARLRAEHGVLRLAAGEQHHAPQATVLALHCFAGGVDVAAGGDSAPLAAGETAIAEFTAPRDVTLSLLPRGAALLAVMVLRPV